MLLEVKNVSIVTVDEFGDGGVEPFAVWALNQQNGAVSHGRSPGGRPVRCERNKATAGARI
jgi:hypothetical protein